jgi:intracellular multiplication protein IcmL
MADEEQQTIRLRKDFYRDGFRKILFILGLFLIVIVLLIATAIYLFLDRPPPVEFSTDNEWRILLPVPLDKPYLPQADLIQWVSTVIPKLFNYDFISYKLQLEQNEQYFTENGWKTFLNLLNNYAAYTAVTSKKLFITTIPLGAPFVLNQGLLERKYSWWVQMPLNINYSNGFLQPLDLQVLVVRISTLNNLYGVAIDNILVANVKK